MLSAETNPVKFQHTFHLSHTFKAINGKTLSTDVFTGLRFPRSDDWKAWGQARLDLQPAWVFRPDEACRFVWWTPGGRLAGAAPSVGHAPAP